MALRCDYTKDTADFDILCQTQDTNISDEWFCNTKINSTGEIVADTFSYTTGTAKFRVLYNYIKADEMVRFIVTPTVTTGDDVLAVTISENSLGS